MEENWYRVEDKNVLNVWEHDKGDYCEYSDKVIVEWTPDMYQDNGTPICPYCGDDLIYSHTLIKEISE